MTTSWGIPESFVLQDPDGRLESLLIQVVDMLTCLERQPRLARVVNRMTLRWHTNCLPITVTAQVGMPMPPDWSSADVAAIERAAFGQLVIADVEWDHPDPSEPDSGEPRWIMEIRSRDGARGFSRHNTHEQALEHRDKILTEAEWQGRAGISTWLSRMTTDDSG